ncbi:TPA: hypothetical protein N0F65_006511 [Lagenidium giganteum]|uniref:ABC1 atypical kinase-like domain-containing protein n=1 Tax=Lagenidium giganteum TaxID=4803 RepID=A0AAV2YQV1_9STRA|nr:TPA: hypothetical protein N0F65_006511 [Lagenidium giganteum]
MASVIFRTAGRAVLATTAIGGAAVAYKANTDEGMARSLYFWRKAMPVYMHYRVTQLYVENSGMSEEEGDAMYEALHDRHADGMFDMVRTLKGFYVKLAQVASTRADFLPKQYMDQAVALQDNAPAMSIEDVKAIISQSYGRPAHEVFQHIDPKPLGAASIGQVHRAVLKDGREVAIKVQHPDSEQCFRWDIGTLKDFARWFQPSHSPYFEEIERQFLTEFDYRGEARNLETIRSNLAKSPFARKIAVPEPYMDLCTREVLVMELLKGKKLIEGIKEHFETIAASRGVTVDELRRQQEEQDRAREALGLDVETGPDAETMRFYLATYAVKKMFRGIKRMLYNGTIGLVVHAREEEEQPEHRLINIPEMLKLIMDVHGHEIFVDGAFNGDPHPGNLMLLEDGRLGLIDFGQVKRLTPEHRLNLAKLTLALHEGTKDDVIRVMTQDMGMRSEKMDAYFLEKQARVLFDRDDRTVTEGMNFQLFMEYLDTIDRFERLPDDFVMAFRASIILRGFSYWLRYRFSHAESWSTLARQVVAEHEGKATS